ncbi:MAG: cobalamin-dependent protein [Spirochaetota bacterium]|nr:MAG: cobalamin-dependent protein [Spirochaetota bacterium]
MSQDQLAHRLVSSFEQIEYHQVKELVKTMLDTNIPSDDILRTMQKGMVAIGEKYEKGEYYLSELMGAAETFKSVMVDLTPHLSKKNISHTGIVVLGTVKGDIHEIGKNLFKTLLQSSGFQVHDLGVDVSPERFVEEINKRNPDILAISSLLTTTMNQNDLVIKQLKKNRLRNRVKIIIGGNAITEEFGREIGADAALRDAMLGANICVKWAKEWAK